MSWRTWHCLECGLKLHRGKCPTHGLQAIQIDALSAAHVGDYCPECDNPATIPPGEPCASCGGCERCDEDTKWRIRDEAGFDD